MQCRFSLSYLTIPWALPIAGQEALLGTWEGTEGIEVARVGENGTIYTFERTRVPGPTAGAPSVGEV